MPPPTKTTKMASGERNDILGDQPLELVKILKSHAVVETILTVRVVVALFPCAKEERVSGNKACSNIHCIMLIHPWQDDEIL